MALSYATPPTFTDGDTVTAHMLNVYGRDNLTYLHGQRPFLRGAAVGVDSAFSIPAGTSSLMRWPRVYHDTGGYVGSETHLRSPRAERVLIALAIVAKPVTGTPPLGVSVWILQNGSAISSAVPVCADTDYGGGVASVAATAAAGDEYAVMTDASSVVWQIAGNIPGVRRCVFSISSIGGV